MGHFCWQCLGELLTNKNKHKDPRSEPCAPRMKALDLGCKEWGRPRGLPVGIEVDHGGPPVPQRLSQWDL